MGSQGTRRRWTIDGVSPAARKVALDAARQENMTIGAWIERAIERAVDAEHHKAQISEPRDPRPQRRYF